MFSRFPLLYIAILYVFSRKDKVVFFMQQFALLIISLCIAVIICAFSVMNGFTEQVKSSILSKASAITIIANTPNKENFVEASQTYNKGFKPFNIKNEEINEIKFIHNVYTFISIGNERYRANIYEDKGISKINSALKQKMLEKQVEEITIFDPFSYSGFTGSLSRSKQFKDFTLDEKIKEQGFVIYLDEQDYQKIIKSKHLINYNKININLFDNDNVQDVAEKIKESANLKEVEIKTWQDYQPDLMNALRLQKKIFLLLYVIMFTLLCAIIISTSIAFFKEKRKDWALLKMLDVIPYSVQKIFLYKNIITFLLSTVLGIILGYLLTIYSNEIIEFLTDSMGSSVKAEQIFGVDKITYQFKINDFITIISFSFGVFLINFLVLLKVFQKESISNILKGN